jgi:hypothetical protein
VPVIAQLAYWGRRHLPVSEELSIRAQVMEEGGDRLIADMMNELRESHLGVKRKGKRPSVFARLQAAYQAVVARKRNSPPVSRRDTKT